MITNEGNDYYGSFGVLKADWHKAIEAEGRLAIGRIKCLIEDQVSDQNRERIMHELSLLAEMLRRQDAATESKAEAGVYSDGSSVFRLIQDGATDLEEKNCLGQYANQDLYESFHSVGELAEHLVTVVLGYRTVVNKPPATTLLDPIRLGLRNEA